MTRWWLLLILWLPTMVLAFPADVLKMDEQLKQLSLHPHLHYQLAESNVTIEDIVFEPERHHAFSPVPSAQLSFKAQDKVVWFFTRLHYQGQRQQTFILDYNFPSANLVEFYSFDRQNHELKKLNRAGTSLPFSERLVKSRSFAVPLVFKVDQELDILIKVQDGTLIRSDFQIWQTDLYYQKQLRANLFDGVMLGLLLLMAAYNLLLYLNVKEALYGYFAGFFVFFSLVIAVLNGAGFAMLWPEHPEVNQAIFYLAVGACLAFLSLATHAMLNHARQSLLWMNLLASALLLFSPLFIEFNHRLLLLLSVLGLVMCTNLLQVLAHTFSGRPRARTFSLSWLLFFAASLVLLLAQLGYMADTKIWQYLLIGSVICSMALMSYGLAQRMQQVTEESTLAHQQAINSLKQYYDIYHNAVEGMFTTTLDGQLIAANRSLLNILGYQELSQMELDVKNYGMGKYYANPDDRLHMVRQLQHSNNQSFELRGLRADGSPFWALMSARLAQNSQGEAFIHGSVVDTTEQKINHEQLAYLASHDPLTGLYNRHHFALLAQQAWHRLQMEQQTSAVLYIDIDQFKLVNSTCNHSAGDALLLQISDQLKRALGSHGVLARLGGDEFAVLLPGKTAQEAFAIAYNLLEVVKEFRFFWQDSLFSISVSIGMSEIGPDDLSAEQTIKKADSACFVAKEKGRNRIHLFHPDDDELQKQQAEIQWVQILQRALEQDSFVLYMQTIQAIQLPENVSNYELLLRLKGEDNSIIAPGNFLSSAERYGLMPQIDRWVIRNYFRWLAQHPGHLKNLGHCSINLSGASLVDPLFKAYVLALFSEYKIPPRHICFEITESMAILNLQNTLDFIHHFRSLGCRFALDDFGSGFSSYGYLKNFPVDYIKIDGNFVRDLLTDKFDRAIVNSIHDVAAAMGIMTVAEYVESIDILQQLRVMGVDYAQGYGIAKPKPLSEL